MTRYQTKFEKGLIRKRVNLVNQNRKEYQTRGNTQRCQELWREIEKIDRLLDTIRKNN